MVKDGQGDEPLVHKDFTKYVLEIKIEVFTKNGKYFR
jgi:hypothetical protein